MHRLSRSTVGLWLLTFALLVARWGDAHLHLCFDGQEPVASVHVSDQASHHDSHETQDAQAHNDTDVNAYGDALAKKSGDTNLLVLAVALVLLLLPQIPILQ